MNDLTDEQLMALSREGNEQAFAVLYGRYRYVCLRLARFYRAGDDAEDVVSDAFTQTWVAIQRGKGPTSAFSSYVFSCVRRGTVAHIAKRQRVILTDDNRTLDSAQPFGGGISPEEAQVVRAAFDSIPTENQRNILWAMDVEGYDTADFAEMSGISKESVSSLLYRARQSLRAGYRKQNLEMSSL